MKKTTDEKIDEMYEKFIRWDERVFGKLGLEARQGLVEIAVFLIIIFLAAVYGPQFINFLR